MDHFLRWVRAEWDRVTGYLLVALGALVLLVGYLGVRHSPYVAEELAFIISGGLGGLFLLGLGGIFLISADLADEWRKLDRIEEILLRHLPPEESPTVDGWSSRPVESSATPDGGGAGRPGLVPTARALLAALPAGSAARFRRLVSGGAVGVVLVVAVLVAAWQRAASTSDPAPALRAAALAGAALALFGAVGASATLRVRRRLAGREALLLGSLVVADASLALSGGGATGSAARPAAVGDALMIASGLRYYHRPGCAALAGLEARAVDAASIPPGAEACGLCRPGSGR